MELADKNGRAWQIHVELGPVIVRLRDGTTFWCCVERIDGERRWIIEAANGAQYLGPRALEQHTPVAIQSLIERWWDAGVREVL